MTAWRSIPALVPLVLLLVLAVTGPWFVQDPFQTNIAAALGAPSLRHWLGTDAIGRDLLSRVVVATRLDLEIAVAAVTVSATIGCTIGAACGLLGGWLDRATQRVVDVLMAFPLFVVALALVAVLGNSVGSVVVATAVINIPFYVRLARSEIAVRRHASYVDAARLNGANNSAILFRLLLPNALPAISVQMTINLGWAMVNSAGLSFLGLGVRPPTAEWGVLVSEGAPYMITGQWWMATFPSLALSVAVLSLSLAGDHVRDHFDPRRR